MHQNLKRIIPIILILFMLNNLQAQNNPQSLWGVWSLDSVTLTKQGVTENHSFENLLVDRDNLPRNMFTSLYFFDNQIGISSTDEFFPLDGNLNQKGTFTTEGNNLTITLQGETPRIFTYFIENELLKIEYTREDVQFHLVYKLTF